jgi:signal transduction histidine kinase
VVLHLHPADDDVELPEQVNLALFRIYQEAISNIVRHANTTKIWVQAEQQDNCIVLDILDNGKGFLVHDEVITEYMQNERYGLAGMKERADAIGGVFRIISEPEKGTRVLVKVPLSGGR